MKPLAERLTPLDGPANEGFEADLSAGLAAAGAPALAPETMAALATVAVLGGAEWWLAALLFFAPDISFAGYLAGPRVGAAIYNLVHVYAFGAAVLAAGAAMDVQLPAHFRVHLAARRTVSWQG